MKYPEEDVATGLFRALTQRFSSTTTTISIQGEGVHWKCTARRENSECAIHCFHYHSFGAEYFTDFKRDAKQSATARTSSREDTIEAVAEWLDGQTVADPYAHFSCVDRTKRALEQLRNAVIAVVPELRQASSLEPEQPISDCRFLRFLGNDRACDVSFTGRNLRPDARFSWDQCQLFQFQPEDASRLAPVLKRWLCDRAPPSAMRAEFTWLEIGELADYYENGRPIEGEFLQSWTGIEQFYRQQWCETWHDVRAMIRAMRECGYDRVVRAGQSMSSLILSRSRRHGLEMGQPLVWFGFHPPLMDVQADFAGVELKDQRIQLTAEITRLGDALVQKEVN